MPRLYQQLFVGLANYEALGEQIIRGIKAAHAFRQTDKVRELSTLLSSIPSPEYQLIAKYYSVWCDLRESKYDIEGLETIIDYTQTYKTKALSSRAAFEVYKGRPDAAVYFYTEALKSSPTVSEYIHISRALAVLKAQEGFHNSSLKDIENLIPMIRHAEPLVCYDVLNSYAAQLAEVGRKDEARNVSRLIVASPFARAYPEWQETARDLREPNPSFVAFEPAPNIFHNVLPMPIPRYVKSEQISYNRPAKVLNFQEWKQKMAKDPNDDDQAKKSLADMNEKELFLRAIELFSNTKIPVSKRRTMLDAIEKIATEPDDLKSDDTDGV